LRGHAQEIVSMPLARPALRLPTLTVLALLAACSQGRSVEESVPACTACHGGNDGDTGAPPRSIAGATATTDVSVGAHTAHVSGSEIAPAIACSACHPDPRAGSTVHGNGAADVVFGGLAIEDLAAAPVWNRVAGSCSATYCHGATLSGGSNTTPVWTSVGTGQAACGSCHGLPPLDPHPEVSADPRGCAACHGETVDAATGAIIPPADGGKHLDGTLQIAGVHGEDWMNEGSAGFHAYSADQGLAGCQGCHGADLSGGRVNVACADCHRAAGIAPALTCTGCHGGNEDLTGAPPRTTWGQGADGIRVGAHATHVAGSAIAPAVACDTCHPAVLSMFAPGHITEATTATVLFSGIAITNLGSIPSWNRNTPTCAVYCHGATLEGGTNTAPTWSPVGTGQAACGKCHGLPPGAPHPDVGTDLGVCNLCHAGTIDENGVIIPPAQGGLHVDGVTEASGGHDDDWMIRNSPGFHAYSANQGLASCQLCHGAALDGVGGMTPIGCADCHAAGNVAPDLDTCTGCHGGTQSTTGAPPRTTWGNSADAVRVGAHTTHLSASAIAPSFGCEVCHPVVADKLTPGHITTATSATVTFSGLAAKGMSPAPTWDRTSPSCAVYCHGATLGGGTNSTPTWSPVGTGQAACGKCHGLPPGDPHPTVTGGLAGCAECHPETMDGTGALIPPSSGGKHLNGFIDGGHNADWMNTSSTAFHAYSADRNLSNCQICHGANLDGVGGSTTVACADCHKPDDGQPPPEAPPLTCTGCHGGVDNTTGAPPKVTWAYRHDPALTALAPVKIGAHSSHVGANPVSGPIACAECHPAPTSMFSVGHIDQGLVTVQFAGPVSGLKGGRWNGLSTPTCSSTYCHGNFVAGKTTNTPSWTGTAQATCGTCHNARPIGYLHKRHQDTNFNDPVNIPWWTGWVTCDQCHSGIAASTSNVGTPTLTQVDGHGPPLHVNGEKTVVFKGGGTWDPQPFEGTCSNMQCHPGESKVWPR
jgi:predicted CxxxxCH...CXXCH cytochrome family protein